MLLPAQAKDGPLGFLAAREAVLAQDLERLAALARMARQHPLAIGLGADQHIAPRERTAPQRVQHALQLRAVRPDRPLPELVDPFAIDLWIDLVGHLASLFSQSGGITPFWNTKQ